MTVSYLPYYLYANQIVEGTVSGDPLAVIAGALVHFIGAVLIFLFGGLSAVMSYTIPLDYWHWSVSAVLLVK